MATSRPDSHARVPPARTIVAIVGACLALGACSADGRTDATGSTADTTTTVAPRCPSFAPGEVSGRVDEPTLDEISGLAVGSRSPDVLWVHNDSGSVGQLVALSPGGDVRGTYTLDGAKNTDWEDIAVGKGPDGVSHVYVGDIGDNGEVRPFVTVYRVPEPQVPATGAPAAVTIDDVERFEFTYPDGPHDAETLMFDPRSGDLYVVTKTVKDLTQLFRAAAPLQPGARRMLEAVPTPGIGDRKRVTAGDISDDGALIGLRTYSDAAVWKRGDADSVATALNGEPCPVSLQLEAQGESFGFGPRADAIFTTSEFVNPDILRYRRER